MKSMLDPILYKNTGVRKHVPDKTQEQTEGAGQVVAEQLAAGRRLVSYTRTTPRLIWFINCLPSPGSPGMMEAVEGLQQVGYRGQKLNLDPRVKSSLPRSCRDQTMNVRFL